MECLRTARVTVAAIVLPPAENFSPAASGAIGLLVHRLARAGAGGVVLGRQWTHKPFIVQLMHTLFTKAYNLKPCARRRRS